MAAKQTKALNKAHHSVDLLDCKIATKRQRSSDGRKGVTAEELFDQALMDYYAAKGAEANPNSFDSLMSDTLRTESLAQKILSMPAMTPGQVLKKLSIIDEELLADLDCEAPVERRHIVAFAALKVDIVRLLANQSE